MSEGLAEAWRDLDAFFAAEEATWGFWREWYTAILNGRPLPWDLSFRIATELTDDDWDKGPAHVAELIARLRAKFDVEQPLKALTAPKLERDHASRLGIGGNSPPEPIDLPPEIQSNVTIVWAAVENIAEEVKSDAPNKSKLQRAAEYIKTALVVCLKWVGRKADLTVDTFIRFGVPAGSAAYIAANPQLFQKLVAAVERWITFLP